MTGAESCPMFISPAYYTPDSFGFQVHLGDFTFFVDHADFYVNTIMSTDATGDACGPQIYGHRAISGVCMAVDALNVVPAR